MGLNLISQVRAEMLSKSFDPPEIIADGLIKRFNRGKIKNAWYVVYIGSTKRGRDFAVAVFGDWRDGSKHIYRTDTNFSSTERAEVMHFAMRRTAETEASLNILRSKAIKEAKQIWNTSEEAGSSEYLSGKKIPSLFGARLAWHHNKKALTLAIRNVHGDMKGLQLIYEDGAKYFLSNQQNKGNFVSIPDSIDLRGRQTVFLCEGFATGASIHLATNHPVVCAMNASNLVDVALALKFKNPQLEMIIAGDDDAETSGNPGRAKATEAAKSTGSKLVFPKHTESAVTDFNDLLVTSGVEEVKRQLSTAKSEDRKVPPSTVLARQFLTFNNMKKSEMRLLAWRKEFYQFDGKTYVTLVASDLFNDVIRFLQSHPLAWVKAGRTLANEVIANIEAMVNAKSERPRPFWIDDPALEVGDIVCVRNGIVGLNNARSKHDVDLLPHTSQLFQTAALPYEFDPVAVCPQWLAFLETVLPESETRAALQEWFGYNLVFDVSFQKFAILFGQGANGKSVCCVVLRALIGEKNVSGVNLEAFDPKRTFQLAATVGRLSNIVEELNLNSKTEEGELKKYVAGGLMTVERKHRDPFEMIPTARLTFATNTLPRFSDSSDGIWRRTLLFPFKVQILDPLKQDRRLVDTKFWKDSGELPGIFTWALEGLFRLRENKMFTESAEMKSGLSDFKIESNPAKEFLLQECEVSQGSSVGSRELYQKYKTQMEASGCAPLPLPRFNAEVQTTFPEAFRPPNAVKKNGTRARYWINLRQISTTDTQKAEF